MSPVFRHGRLRLYLLRLLDEEPRHGYEVIRMLRDQFMGVYAPSPGTIYPRLARLEEEGLVTHDEVDGRKVYRITDAGRQELRDRDDELTELEQELSDSVRDVVREVKEDVRETVRSLREELTWAARSARRPEGPEDAAERERAARDAGSRHDQFRTPAEDARERARQVREEAKERARRARDDAKERVRQAREQARTAHEHDGGHWPGWTDWPGRTEWPGRRGWPGRPDVGIFRDLERIVREFAGDLRRLAWQSGASGDEALADLRLILEDALERVKNEIFGTAGPHDAGSGEDTRPGPGTEPPAGANPAAGTKREPGSGPGALFKTG
jgi:DNA-binding PadR family transcriptional regulator